MTADEVTRRALFGTSILGEATLLARLLFTECLLTKEMASRIDSFALGPPVTAVAESRNVDAAPGLRERT